MRRRVNQGWVQRLLILAACLALIGSYMWYAVRAFQAERLASRSDRDAFERAVALAPQNATYHELLCRSMMFSSQDRRAVTECEAASELNPYSSAIWLDLAQAEYSTGDRKLTSAAIRRALAVDPTTPDTAWSAANFLLIQGDTANALKEFAMVLRQEPSLVGPVLNVCWQSLHDINLIESILPANPEVYLSFIKLLLSTGESGAANQVWSAFLQLNKIPDYHNCLFYIDSLLRARAVAQASDAWKQLSSKSVALKAYFQPNNLVMDGSFTQEILNSGFGWRYAQRPQISVALDTAEYHSQGRSIRLIYNGSNSDAGIFQYIAANPNTKYRLSAWVKSDDLETANGPALAVIDGYGNEVFGATQETMGTTGWHRVETEFETGPDTKLLILTILRRPGETRIQGKFWFDDVVLAQL
jgi:tetratricopeptide (TPR) repeat protein